MLFTPDAHEPLAGEAWDVEHVREAIALVVADAEEAFEDGWPTHALDIQEGDDEARRYRTIYLGGSGVVAALHRLAQRDFVELRRDYVPYLETSLEADPDFPDMDGQRSLWMGEVGIRLVLQRLSPSPRNFEQLTRLIAENERDERRELMWGSPGTILAGRELGIDTSASEEWLRGQRDADGLWTQHMRQVFRFLGPAHGFAGCVLALGDTGDVAETLRREAVVADGLVNWPAFAGQPLEDNPDRQIRVQWCHGAPGIVATLAHLLDEDAAVGGGELTWRAGPLRKGANLCHGTAGNGYAFLALQRRTGDELWLERARSFAMHAISQLEQARKEYGRGRYSLWTGDIGTALYLADCIDGDGQPPLP